MLSYVNCSRRAASQVQNVASQILRPAANCRPSPIPSVHKQIRSCQTYLSTNGRTCGSNYSFKRPSSTPMKCNMIRRGCILTPPGSRSLVSSSSPRNISARVAAVEEPVESDEELTNGAARSDAQIHVTPDHKLLVNGNVLLSDVPQNIVVTQHGSYGAFIGASSDKSKSRHVFPLGVFKDQRFMCCFRFSLWWMTQRMGTLGRDIPTETQFMLVELNKGSSGNGDQDATQYAVLLPLLDGQFRASLQGDAAKDNLELCIESGDASVETQEGRHSVFLHMGSNPFQVISEAVKAVEAHLGTFQRRENKKMPGILDWFGWCTWDAFYTDVTADGVRQGLQRLEEGGTPAKFLIIDDGWQSVSSEKSTNEESQDAKRLSDVRENFKFQKDGKEGVRQEDPKLGLHHLVREIKQKHKLEHVYVWHAITGYWGGIKPDAIEMSQYQGDLHYPLHTEGLLNNHPAIGVDHLTINGFGLPHPDKVFQFYDDLHSYLAAAGVDGVKVDVQNILETLGTGIGGRVLITKHYQQALEQSVARNFPGNGCIACMSHNTDGLYSINNTGIVRASDDFFPRDPASHTIHIAAVSYNSLFLGEFMQPDWDMFHSVHPVAEYHAAARAISGGPVYVSDKPGNHDFSLLRKLVLPDGSILRAQLPGRPTRDCLFTDPARDGKSLLKIWNLNKYTGVVGVFNCQGAGWCKVDKKMIVHDSDPKTVSSTVYASDVDSLSTLDNCDSDPAIFWNGDCAIYSQKQDELVCLASGGGIPVSLNVLEYDIFTVSPVKRFSCGTAFAPIGLVDMFNSGGAISNLHYSCQQRPSVEMTVHGCGQLGAYSSCRPTDIKVNGVTSNFSYDENTQMVKVALPQLENLWQKVQFTF